jgi:hypothetical protein
MTTLIDSYVAEVGQRLPEKNRADIENEIRSLIQDTLEDRSHAQNRQPDEDLVVEVLKEFGSPDKMAASYLPARYLIGPRLYPNFMLVMKIVLGIGAIVALVVFGVEFSQSSLTLSDFASLLGKSLLNFMASGLQWLGNIVIIFALLEWILPRTKLQFNREWDPRTLKMVDIETETLRPLHLIWDIAMTAAVLLFFNLYPQWVGMASYFEGHWVFVPLLNAEFYRYLPWWDAVWVLTIVLNIVLIRQGSWQLVTRLCSLGLAIFTMLVLNAMLIGTPIITLTSEMLTTAGYSPDAVYGLNIFTTGIITGYKLLLVLLIVLKGVNIIKTVVRMVSKKK